MRKELKVLKTEIVVLRDVVMAREWAMGECRS